MLIPISADEGAATAWAMLEMQGEIERKDGGTLEEAFDVGTLSVSSSVSGAAGRRRAATFTAVEQRPAGPAADAQLPLVVIFSMQGAVMLTIGYHQLEGKRIELKKPFAVLDLVAAAEGQAGEVEEESAEYKVRMLTSCCECTRRWS